MTSKNNPVVVGLDIGTTKIYVVIAELSNDDIKILGVGKQSSLGGLKKGIITNVESTVTSIKNAIQEAELMSGYQIKSAYLGIAGSHIKGINSNGLITVKNKEITQEDVTRVIDAAQAINIPSDREIIHVLPQEFIVDEQNGILDPVGMVGMRLQVNVHIVTSSKSHLQNLIKCAARAGINVSDIVLQPIASSESVLTAEEKELGVALVDFGGGTTDLAIYSEGTLKHTAIIGIGGNNLTNDIALGLKTPMSDAERLKIEYGCCFSSFVNKEEAIDVPSVGDRKPRKLPRQILSEILEVRVEEMLNIIDIELIKSGFKEKLASGIVITGGSSLIKGLAEMSDQVFQLPTRIASPKGFIGLTDLVEDPSFATVLGLIIYGARLTDDAKPMDFSFGEKVMDRLKKLFNL
jgi:cell division protein FtsA